MGLLDEAIREHLELKRLRGADPADVARMEREALGPARRPDSEAAASAETVPGAAIPFDAELDQPEAAGAAAVAEPGDHGASGDEYDVPANGLQAEAPPAAMYD